METGLFNVMSREYVLKNAIDGMRKSYDYILIDCMPSLGMMTVNALVAADSGMEWFMRNREFIPDLAVGDFDSLSEEGKKYMESLNGLKIIRLKPEKDDSDTQSAVNHMISEGSREILILGATGTRLDHVLANLGLLSMGREKGVHIALADQWNYITLVDSGTVLKKEEQFGKYVSFFTVGGDVSGLTLKGFKYPLDGYDLTVADSGLTVSNEIAAETAEVTYDRGSLLMIMSRD